MALPLQARRRHASGVAPYLHFERGCFTLVDDRTDLADLELHMQRQLVLIRKIRGQGRFDKFTAKDAVHMRSDRAATNHLC